MELKCPLALVHQTTIQLDSECHCDRSLRQNDSFARVVVHRILESPNGWAHKVSAKSQQFLGACKAQASDEWSVAIGISDRPGSCYAYLKTLVLDAFLFG